MPIEEPNIPPQQKPDDWDVSTGILDGRVFTTGYSPDDPVDGLVQAYNSPNWVTRTGPIKIKKLTGDPVDPTGDTYTDESNFRPWAPADSDRLYDIPMGSPARQGHIDNAVSAAINAQKAVTNVRTNLTRILGQVWDRLSAQIAALVDWAGYVYSVLVDHETRITTIEEGGPGSASTITFSATVFPVTVGHAKGYAPVVIAQVRGDLDGVKGRWMNASSDTFSGPGPHPYFYIWRFRISVTDTDVIVEPVLSSINVYESESVPVEIVFLHNDEPFDSGFPLTNTAFALPDASGNWVHTFTSLDFRLTLF